LNAFRDIRLLFTGATRVRRYHPAIHIPRDRVRVTIGLAVPFLAALSVACSSDFGPGSGTTRYYRLDAVDSRSVPTVFDSAATAWYSVGSDTIVFDGASDTVREVFHGWETSTRGPVQYYSGTTTSVYQVRGDSIEIISNTTCPPACSVNRGGHISEAALTLRVDENISPNPAWTYRRVSGPR
jgi:hypothetical protein